MKRILSDLEKSLESIKALAPLSTPLAMHFVGNVLDAIIKTLAFIPPPDKDDSPWGDIWRGNFVHQVNHWYKSVGYGDGQPDKQHTRWWTAMALNRVEDAIKKGMPATGIL